MEPIIRLTDVNFHFDRGKSSELWALKHISLEIQKGDYVVFFGPSGCGKSTLLYVVSGIEADKVSSGNVYINGRDIAQFSRKELSVFRQIGIGIVFQNFNLIPSISVLENVTLPMAFLGISGSRRKEEGMHLLERLAIEHLADRYPSELSGGQQQRVGIARALANNAPIIIADEPLGNLDSENANKVLEFFKELNEKDGRTIIMVTHEAWSVRDAKKIFYMKDGEIIKNEAPATKAHAAKSISHYYEGLYPQASSKEIVAKSLSHLFLRGYSMDEIKRFEFYFLQRLEGKIDADMFFRMLDKPYKEGGVGLWKSRAQKIQRMTEELIEEKKRVDDIYKELKENPDAPLFEEVAKIRAWLVEEYKGVLTSLQTIRLSEVISERIRNIITSDNFQRVLGLPQKQLGVGLSRRATQRMAEKLEIVLTSPTGGSPDAEESEMQHILK